MYKPINGWTKESMIAAIMKNNNGTQAMDETYEYCTYKNDAGNRCAVGCFIPEDTSEKVFKHRGSAISLLDKYPDLKVKMPLSGLALESLQQIHDKNGINENVRDRMIAWINENVE